MKAMIRHTLAVAGTAFVVQLLWEYSVCGPFYIMEEGPGHTWLMLSATFGDMNMSVGLLWLLLVVNQNSRWLTSRWSRADASIMVLLALFLSFYFEIHALHQGRWGYNPETMPLVPGTPIGLVPVIQLVVLFPLIFFIASKGARWIEEKEKRGEGL